MTSPDGSGIPSVEDVGAWPIEIDLLGLGDALIFGPIRQLLSSLTGLPIETWPTVPEIVDGITGFFADMGEQAMAVLRQIGDIFEGLVVTPINNVVSQVKDWFLGLVGWQGQTTGNHQALTNQVWAGASTVTVTEDKTAEEVRDAVATLKARSEALQTENELRYRTSVPLWQGLIPGGDVTAPLDHVNLRDDWWFSVNGTSSGQGFPSHDHGPGSYAVNLNLGSQTGAVYGGALGGGFVIAPMAAFRARSDAPRNVITFLARGSSGAADVRVALTSYNYDSDRWDVVSQTVDVRDQISLTNSYTWVDAQLETEYTPEIGELMGVAWTLPNDNVGNFQVATTFSPGPKAAHLVPAYHSVPYGTCCIHGYSIRPTPGESLDLRPPEVNWYSTGTPYAQIAPDLGQTIESPPQYWFDDFNSNLLGGHYSTWRNSGGSARLSSGRFSYNGGGFDSGYQCIFRRGQMSTDRIRIEATASNAEGAPAAMYLGTTNTGNEGVALRFTSTRVLLTLNDIRGDRSTGTIVRDVAFTSSGSARWAIEYDPATTTYTVQRNGVTITTWADPTNRALRGRGHRTGGLGVTRGGIIDGSGPAWDDLLIFDVTDD